MAFDTILTDDLIEEYTSKGFWHNNTLGDYLDETVKEYPRKVAIVDNKGSLTYSELYRSVFRFAVFLLKLGVKKDDIVSVQLPSWSEFAIVHFALSKIGVITNPIAPYYRKNELTYFLKKAGSVALIIPDFFKGLFYPDMVHQMRAELPDLKHVIVVGDEVPDSMIPFQHAIEDDHGYPSDYLDQFRPDPNDVHVLMFTSGTEARPKGVLHTHNTYANATLNIVKPLGLSSQDVFFMAAPVTHTTGIRFGIRLPMMLGSKVVLQDLFNPEEALRLIAEEKCTITVGATPFLHGFVNAKNLRDVDISSFRVFACGGSPIPRDLVKEGERELSCNILACFGSTESPSQTFNKPGDPPDKIFRSDGYPLEGVEIKIYDEKRKELPNREIGEAACRGPQLFVGYYREPDITKKSFTEDGYFFTGDLCVLDQDGYLRVEGRKKDIIIRGGLNISAGEVENILHAHPKIKQVALIGMPDPKLGERVCAYLVPEKGKRISFEEVTEFLKLRQVAVIKLPERVELVETLPMTQSGKVRKNLLREDISRKIEGERAVESSASVFHSC
ncbi:MAG: AMP-binding protein [Desulfatiglans sp.]|jgi:non-ribosomal peptide synthetase component E (peptide arylation enzyme)|nr:AMP-binding protein [Desulfatiglans sp.]